MPDFISKSSDGLLFQILSLVFFGVVNLELIVEEVIDMCVKERFGVELVSNLHLEDSFEMEFVLDCSDLDDVGIEEVVLEEPRKGSSDEDFPGRMSEGNYVLFDVVEEVTVLDGLIFIHPVEVIDLFLFFKFDLQRSQMTSIDERDLSQFRSNGFLFFLFGFIAFLS